MPTTLTHADYCTYVNSDLSLGPNSPSAFPHWGRWWGGRMFSRGADPIPHFCGGSDDPEKHGYCHYAVILGRNPILFFVTWKRTLDFFLPEKWGRKGCVLFVHSAAGTVPVWFNAMLHGDELSSIWGIKKRRRKCCTENRKRHLVPLQAVVTRKACFFIDVRDSLKEEKPSKQLPKSKLT